MPGEKDLHSYQKFCVDFLEEKPQCALFLDCGLGKTIITLTAISHLLYDSYEVSRVLIIAPLRVARDTWIGELSKWEHLKRLYCSEGRDLPAERIRAGLYDGRLIRSFAVSLLLRAAGRCAGIPSSNIGGFRHDYLYPQG